MTIKRGRVACLFLLGIAVMAGVLKTGSAASAFNISSTAINGPSSSHLISELAIAGLGSPMSKISPDVLRETADGKRAEVLILLADQADVSRAYNISDHDERGWFVYNALTSHADRTQAGLRAMLAAERTSFQTYWAANMIIATADRNLVDRLAARADVARIDSNKPTRWIEDPAIADERPADQPDAPGAIEWGVSNVNAPQVWALGFRGQGIVIGGLDTGIRWTHNSIKAKYRGWNGTTADHNYNWWDAIHSGGGTCGFNTTAPCDDNSHGTHTVGTMVGDDGGANQIGVAPDAKWIGCRNMNVGNGTPATYTECFQFMIAPTNLAGTNPDPTRRPHILNNSWGCPASEGCTAGSELETIVSNTQAAGIFIVVSAGNSGNSLPEGCSTVSSPPATYSDSFSVGSITSTNGLSSFSSRGPSTFYTPNLLKPNISAPGSNVRSSIISSDTSYGNKSGTSMAGPHVAGVIALLWSARPHLSRNIAATKTLLQNTANPNVTAPSQICGGIPSTQIPNNSFGYGRVDALAAVNGAPTPTPTATPTATPPPAVIRGRVTYENAAASVMPIPNASITAAGSPMVAATTTFNGDYVLIGFGAGPYTVTPAKADQPPATTNGIFANDAAMISRHVVGLLTLNSTQIRAAKVAGQPTLSALDAAMIARYIVGTQTGNNLTGKWTFTPVNRSYASVTSEQTGQDYAALLMGDVTGDWSASTRGDRWSTSERMLWDSVLASVAGKNAVSTGKSVAVPLRIDNLKGSEITSFQFDIEYDPSVVTPAKVAADISATQANGLTVVSNVVEPGLLKVVVFGAIPATGDGVYVNLRFNGVGDPGSSSKITINGFRHNDGTDPVITADGQIAILPR